MTKPVKLAPFDHLITDNICLPERKQTTKVSYDRCSLTQHTNAKYKYDIYNDFQLKVTDATPSTSIKACGLWLKCYFKKPYRYY